MRAPARAKLKELLTLDRLLLRSRFGRRLLLLFLTCALLPTLAVGYLAYATARDQLLSQSLDRLHALAGTAGRALLDRLEHVDADLREAASAGARCRPEPGGVVADVCGVELSYAAQEVFRLDAGGITAFGGSDTTGIGGPVAQLALGPGQSGAVVARTADGPRIVLVHRVAAAGRPVQIAAQIAPSYVWVGDAAEGLPPAFLLGVFSRQHGGFVQGLTDPNLSGSVDRAMAASATGDLEWSGADGPRIAAYWSFPSSRRLRLAGLAVVVSQPTGEMYAPVADFVRTFPVVLLLSLVGVAGFGLRQIRRSMLPLEALHAGTRRIAAQDFDARVSISSRDELEDLAHSFNAMAARLGKQFAALRAVGDIDRAVLSSVDRTRIVETALSRLPELVRCECVALVAAETPGQPDVEAWTANAAGHVHRLEEPAVLLGPDVDRLGAEAEHLRLPPESGLAGIVGATAFVDLFPIRFGADLSAALLVRWSDGAEPTAEDLGTIRRVADQVAVALGNARMVEQVRYMAFYDSLTGLPNRVYYKDAVTLALRRAERKRRRVAVCFLDLDNFSTINDTLGHEIGDELVRAVGARLLACCRDTDTVARLGVADCPVEVARLGGDEFTVVLPDLGDPQDAGRVARRLLACFARPFELGHHEVFVSTSIGIAVFPEDGRTADELLRNADVAMYHAKDQGRNSYRMFSASMNQEAMARMQLDQQLRRAVEAGQFTVVYQPIAEVETGAITGAEALVRWAHPERGLVSPGEFIALLEESGLIVRLGNWILREVCSVGRRWEAAGLGPVRLCVNLSARQLQHEDFVGSLAEILAETGLEARSLVLELTESALMEPGGQISETISALADTGIRFAVDDFGTGYSSLAYLKHFPIDTLKIDRSFVHHIVTSPDDAAIAAAIVALARALSLNVVAEGVETSDQLAILRRLGCQRAQGHLVGHPVSADQFEALLSERAAAPATR